MSTFERPLTFMRNPNEVLTRDLTSALETQRDLRRRLTNDVSHELTRPLTIIQLEATGLRDRLQAPESASDHIIQGVDRLRGLVTDLDWLAETDSGGSWVVY